MQFLEQRISIALKGICGTFDNDDVRRSNHRNVDTFDQLRGVQQPLGDPRNLRAYRGVLESHRLQ